jgi:tRNA A-37 threonylcarbamoyl transferase component Bud32/dienelactone hydrolase
MLLSPGGELPSGAVLAGKYRIVEIVGRGGMGVVYKAEDTKLHRLVALKFLPSEMARNQAARERFVVEARAAAALSHPNICTIHEIHDEEETPFIEMEYIEGRTLKKRIREYPLGVSEVVDLAIQVAEALEEAHRRGIIHRDIKSSNIMVTDRGQAKVMDFGLAEIAGETLHTREGSTLGTVAYMSPEQARGEQVDQRTDLWSFGVVLYEMLSGRMPFTGDKDASILYSVVHEEAKSLKDVCPGLSSEVQQMVNRPLKKDVKARYASAAEMGKDLRRYRDNLKAEELSVLTPRAFLRIIRRPQVTVATAACVLVLSAAGAWFYNRQSKIRWAREHALPEIQRITLRTELGYANLPKAYALAKEAVKYIPSDPVLTLLLEKCSVDISIKTAPPGAAVYMKEFSAPDEQWQYLGVSPIEKLRVPIGYFWWRMQKEGYETVLAVAPTIQSESTSKTGITPYNLYRVLDPNNKIPPGMVRVLGAKTVVGQLDDFFIDKYEVTNKQYKGFVDAGGYRDRKYWKNPFVKSGKTLTWDEVMAEFVDQSARPGPSTWQGGDYARGHDDQHVSGVRWNEAAAYADYAGKRLHTVQHWGLAVGEATPLFDFTTGWLGQLSNFKGEGPAPVGTHQSMTAYGAYDLPGNVREWCWNESRDGRVVRGGAWNDATYMMENLSQAPAFDRSPKNGFRCALYPDRGKIPAKAFEPELAVAAPDFHKQKPVPDSVFQVYKDQFLYDKKELNAHVEWRDASSGDWVQEKVTVDAAYGNEKVPMYLFVPKRSSPPYQAVIYFPGSPSIDQMSSKDLDSYREFESHVSFIVKNGRAVLYPVYKGTFERRDDAIAAIYAGANSRQYTKYIIQVVQDFNRCVDYLETRPDIDRKRLAYLSFSWGSRIAPIVLAVNDRLRASVMMVGGFRAWEHVRPEADEINYVTRVKVPTLMLNGRYDTIYPLETTVKPMFEMLGTPAEQKRLKVYDTDHFVPQNELIKASIACLDRYLWPVR